MRTKGINVDGSGFAHANRIRQLHIAFCYHARRYQMFGDVSGRIRRTAIHLAGVFARERTAAVRTTPAIGIDHDFASGEAGIAMGAANQEAPRRVDQILGLFNFNPLAQNGFQRMMNHRRMQFRLADVFRVLGRYHYFVDRYRPVFVVGHRHLRFRIRPKPWQGVIVAQLLEFLYDLVR